MKKTAAVILTICLIAAAAVVSIFNLPPKPVNYQSFAMGSSVNITVYGEKSGEEIAREAAEKINELDSKYLSNTMASSFTYKLNNERTAQADEYFKKYLENCLSMSAESECFTLLSGQLKELWKTEDGGYIPTDDELSKLLPDLSEEIIKLDGNKVSLENDSIIDFGALGKGTACQSAIDSIRANGAENAVCTVGGTVGVIGKPDGKDKFTIGVRNPFGSQDDYFGTLSVTDCFISTSGDYEKYFLKDGVRYCHIFDATTGKPVQNDITSVTVVAGDGTVSDFLSTAVFCEGAEKGLALAQKYNAEVIIVKKDKTVIVSDGLRDSFALTDNNFTVKPR